ncbi:MAG: hypothetical protein II339_02480, partial [Spirochaetales bacterium]|nr:hypothetical protein [Spirochaetales bacterium]
MLKEFLLLIKRFISPYKKYLAANLILNFLAQILNVFSFALLIPILQILFKVTESTYTHMTWADGSAVDVIKNNFYYYMTSFIDTKGALWVLIMSGVILAVMTLLKTACYFGSSATLIPLRTGVIRDIRIQVYNKVMKLPLGFFSNERKGDIIARVSSDVGGLENAMTHSLEMLIKNPIAIVVTLIALFAISWELTLFVFLVMPMLAWVMGIISRNLKRGSKEAQDLWGVLLAQLEETLGGLRIIKAFIAEEKMKKRFTDANNVHRKAVMKMSIRQACAHPASEFMGTCIIVIVLWGGGYFILGDQSSIDASSFIYYLVLLYNIL